MVVTPIACILANTYTNVYMLINPIDDKKYWVPDVFVSTSNNDSTICKFKTTKTPGECTLQVIEWKEDPKQQCNFKRYESIAPTIIPKFDEKLMLICSNPKCPGKISSDNTKADGNKIHSSCYFRFMTKDKRQFPTIKERDENNPMIIRKEFFFPACSKICSQKITTIVNAHNRMKNKETERVDKIRTCIENQDWSKLPDMDADNITPNGRTSNQIILDWYTNPENCNKYHGANHDITNKTSGVTKEGYRVKICNIIFEELGKFFEALISKLLKRNHLINYSIVSFYTRNCSKTKRSRKFFD